MFYSSTVFVTKGKLAPIWLAANWGKKLKKNEVHELSVMDAVRWIISPSQPLALRLSGKLLKGVVRLWQRKMAYLHEDCNDALKRLKNTLCEDRTKKKGGGLLQKRSGLLTSKSERKVQDLFSDMPSDLGMMSVEEMITFIDDGNSCALDDSINQARAQDIQLDEDIISSWDLSKDRIDDGSLMLEDQEELHAWQNSSGHSLLMDALNHDISYCRRNYPVEKGRTLNLDFNLLNEKPVNLYEDDDTMYCDSDNEELPSKENLSMNNNPVMAQAIKDYCAPGVAIPNRALEYSCTEPNMDSHVLREQRISENTPVEVNMPVQQTPSRIVQQMQHPQHHPIERVNDRKRRKPITDEITELANEIISAQLKDTSNIVWEERPFADLSEQSINVCDGQDLWQLLLKPLFSGYAPELMECYEDCWRKRKRVKLNPEDDVMDTGCSISARRLFNQSKSILMDWRSDDDQGCFNPVSVTDIGKNGGSDITRRCNSSKSNLMTTPRVFRMDNYDNSEDDNNNYTHNSNDEENTGFSTRTQKMLQYLTDKEKSDFVYQDMVKGKARITAAGFFYELLVLKTHVMIDLKQDEAYGKIDFSRTNNIAKTGVA